MRRAIATTFRKLLGRSDYTHWSSLSTHSSKWDTRTQKLAQLIPPNSTVIEFGAGRLMLRDMLPEGCSYTPSDLVDRGYNTIVLDLNAKCLPTLARYDVAVFSGVFEYVIDVPRLVRYLGDFAGNVICSYAVVELNQRGRCEQGWVNDYTSGKFVSLFTSLGFDYRFGQRWKAQMLYGFRNKTSNSAKHLHLTTPAPAVTRFCISQRPPGSNRSCTTLHPSLARSTSFPG